MNQQFQYFQPYKYLYGFVGMPKGALLVLLVLTLLSAAVNLLQVRLTQALIDTTIAEQPVRGILALFLLGVVCISALTHLSGTLTARLSSGVIKNIKDHVADRMLTCPYQEMAGLSSGDVLVMANEDTDAVTAFLESGLPNMATQLFMALIAWAYLALCSPTLALLAFLYTPLGVLLTALVNRRLSALHPAKAQLQSAFLSKMEQCLSNIPVIKSFLLEKQTLQALSLNQEQAAENAMQISKYNALLQTACGAVSDFPKLLYLLAAGALVFKGEISVGFFIAAFDMLTYIVQPTVVLPFTLHQYQRSMASLKRIMKLDALPREQRQPLPKMLPGLYIHAEALCFCYGSQRILSGLSFQLDGPGLYQISGKSGCGKTTLLDLIAGLLAPTSGTLSVCGFAPSAYTMSKAIAVVPQDARLLCGSIRENLLGNGAQLTDAQQKQVSPLLSFVEALPQKYETIVGAGGRELSGGERQRIAVARAMLSNAPIWLLDEITSATDREAAEQIHQMLQKEATHRLILVCTHDASLNGLTHRVVRL